MVIRPRATRGDHPTMPVRGAEPRNSPTRCVPRVATTSQRCQCEGLNLATRANARCRSVKSSQRCQCEGLNLATRSHLDRPTGVTTLPTMPVRGAEPRNAQVADARARARAQRCQCEGLNLATGVGAVRERSIRCQRCQCEGLNLATGRQVVPARLAPRQRCQCEGLNLATSSPRVCSKRRRATNDASARG